MSEYMEGLFTTWFLLFCIGLIICLLLLHALIVLYKHIKYYSPTETYGSKELRDIEGHKYRKY